MNSSGVLDPQASGVVVSTTRGPVPAEPCQGQVRCAQRLRRPLTELDGHRKRAPVPERQSLPGPGQRLLESVQWGANH